VTLEVDYVDRRSRLTTFFRFLLAIPLVIVGYVYLIGLGFVTIAAWFVLLFTGRWPLGMYNFSAGVLRFTSRMNAYLLLTVDRYPPFGLAPDDSYPARLHVAQSALSQQIRDLEVDLGATLLVRDRRGVIVVTGRQPQGLQNAIVFCMSYTMRAYALIYLLTETYPPFDA